MRYVVIGLVLLAIAAIAAILFFRKKKMCPSESEKVLDDAAMGLTAVQSNEIIQPDSELDVLVIPTEMLPAEAIPDKSKLVEITDSTVLARVSSLIPSLAQASVAGANAVQAVKSGSEVLYRAIIPAGAKLTKSKAMEGAVRGFYRGADGIQGQANLVAVQAKKGTAIAANTASAAMSVASMVVGQYYMTQINAELGRISDGIDKISEFQDNEFQSRIISLVAHVKKIADFQVEILDNDELRLSKIAQLDSLEEECTKLLGQVNLTLKDFAKKNDLEYTDYEKMVKEAQKWFDYQMALLEVLYKISELRYTLHMGAVSREQCNALIPTYTKQRDDALAALASWHQAYAKRFKIDLAQNRRRRTGLDRASHSVPGLFNDKYNYRHIGEGTASMITAQSSAQALDLPHDISDLYSEDVQLFSIDGKVYYLPMDEIN